MALFSSIPFLLFYDTVQTGDSAFCIRTYDAFNDTVYVFTNFVLWYLIPLSLMSFMYTRISIVLWRSSKPNKLCEGSQAKKQNTSKISSADRRNYRPRRLMKLAYIAARKRMAEKHLNGTGYLMEPLTSDKGGYVMEPLASDKGGCVMGSVGGNGRDIEMQCLSQPDCQIVVVCDMSDNTVETPVLEHNKDYESCSNTSRSPASSIGKRSPTPSIGRRSPTPSIGRRSTEGEHTTRGSPTNLATPKRCPTSMLGTGSDRSIASTFGAPVKAVRFVDKGVPDKGEQALLARRRVIRLLIAVVLAFAICVLPSHVYQMWHQTLAKESNLSLFTKSLLPPITYLILYLNSALNPFLYAFLSENFRKSLKDILHGFKKTGNNRTIRNTMSSCTMKTANSMV